LELRFIERRKLWLGRAEFLKMLVRISESVVICVAHFAIRRYTVAPSQRVRFRSGGDGGFVVTFVTFDLREHVQGVGVEDGIRAAFGGIPNLIEEFAGDGGFVFAPVEFGLRGECGEFFFEATDRAGAGERVLEALGGGIQVVQTERGGAVKTRGADEVDFVALDSGKFPGALSKGKSTVGFDEPEAALGEEGADKALALLIFPPLRDFQVTLEDDFRCGSDAAKGQIKSPLLLSQSFRIAVLMLAAQLNGPLASRVGLAEIPRKRQGVGKISQINGGIRRVVFALGDFDGTAEKKNGTAGLTAKNVSRRQRIEGVTLISGRLQARRVPDPIGEKGFQKFGALAAGAKAIESGLVQVFAEKVECIAIAFEANQGLVKFDCRREILEASYIEICRWSGHGVEVVAEIGIDSLSGFAIDSLPNNT